MGTPLKNPPVYLTLAQVGFNPVLKLTDFLPGIQEAFRRAGYPDFMSQPFVSLQFTGQDSQPPVAVSQERFLFGNIEKTCFFVLGLDGLALQSSAYGYFEAFRERFLKGLGLVHEQLSLDFTQRVGLRYLDRVMPRSSAEGIEQYLVPEARGLRGPEQGVRRHAYQESLSEVGEVRLLSRVVIQEGGLAFPPDLQHLGMSFPERFVSHHGISALLDHDAFLDAREAFSVQGVSAHFEALHRVISDSFKSMVTKEALSIWSE